MRLRALKVFTLLAMLFVGAVTASAQTLDQTDEILAENPELNDIETSDSQPLSTSKTSKGNIVGSRVVLRTLDKVTARTQDFTIPIGDSLEFGTLTVKTFHCEIKPPEAIPETFAFLQIFEPKRLTKDEKKKGVKPELQKLFSGWMLASEPAISALDHGVYDVWVLGCEGGDIPAQ